MRRTTSILALLAFAPFALVAACAESAGLDAEDDGGSSSAPRVEAGAAEDGSSSADGGGGGDARANAEAGAGADAGANADATPDAGANADAGADAGANADAGADADAGHDASTADAGSDAGPTAAHVHILIDNFCNTSTSPTEIVVPTGTIQLTYHNHSVDYEADVWLSYGGGFLGLARGAEWPDRFVHCATPNPYVAYADVSIAGGSSACPGHRLYIRCH